MDQFDTFNYVDTDNIFHKTKSTTSNAALSNDQAILLCTLDKEVWSCVARAYPQFFICCRINEISNFGAAMMIHFFSFSSITLLKNLAFFCFFCKLFILHIYRKCVEKPSVMQTSTVSHHSVQRSRSQICLLCGYVVFGGRMGIPDQSY